MYVGITPTFGWIWGVYVGSTPPQFASVSVYVGITPTYFTLESVYVGIRFGTRGIGPKHPFLNGPSLVLNLFPTYTGHQPLSHVHGGTFCHLPAKHLDSYPKEGAVYAEDRPISEPQSATSTTEMMTRGLDWANRARELIDSIATLMEEGTVLRQDIRSFALQLLAEYRSTAPSAAIILKPRFWENTRIPQALHWALLIDSPPDRLTVEHSKRRSKLLKRDELTRRDIDKYVAKGCNAPALLWVCKQHRHLNRAFVEIHKAFEAIEKVLNAKRAKGGIPVWPMPPHPAINVLPDETTDLIKRAWFFIADTLYHEDRLRRFVGRCEGHTPELPITTVLNPGSESNPATVHWAKRGEIFPIEVGDRDLRKLGYTNSRRKVVLSMEREHRQISSAIRIAFQPIKKLLAAGARHYDVAGSELANAQKRYVSEVPNAWRFDGRGPLPGMATKPLYQGEPGELF